MATFSTTRRAFLAIAASAAAWGFALPVAAQVNEITIDFATYNPVGLVLKEKGWLEESLKADGISVRWVQSAGSNKALEFLNAGSIDFGSTAGAAALIGRVNGNPIKSIYVYSRPEWTALGKTKGQRNHRRSRTSRASGWRSHVARIRTSFLFARSLSTD